MNSSPYLTFGQVAANSAILEALVGESHVHIIDFGIGHALQWPALLQALAARPGGPPHVRLTGIETPQGGPRKPYCVYKAGARLTVRTVLLLCTILLLWLAVPILSCACNSSFLSSLGDSVLSLSDHSEHVGWGSQPTPSPL